jgi:hypothetical protein
VDAVDLFAMIGIQRFTSLSPWSQDRVVENL